MDRYPLARRTFISQHITPFNFWIIRFRSLNASNFFSPVILHVHELLVSVFSRWLGYDGTFPSRLSGPLSFIIVITHDSVVMFVVFWTCQIVDQIPRLLISSQRTGLRCHLSLSRSQQGFIIKLSLCDVVRRAARSVY